MEAIILTSQQFENLTASIEEIKCKLEKTNTSGSKIFIDNQEFIDLMKISPRTAQKWRDEGIVTFSQIGNKIYYRMDEIEDLLNKQKVKKFK